VPFGVINQLTIMMLSYIVNEDILAPSRWIGQTGVYIARRIKFIAQRGRRGDNNIFRKQN
jgi:hypothetical protein